MKLIDENEELEQEAHKKKTFKIILISIAVLTFIAIVLLAYSVIKKNHTLTLSVDGKNQNITPGLLYMDESNKNVYEDENGKIYISVKKLATILNVDYYNDEYKNKGEDTTKCYIKTENEYTSYLSNSSQIYKAVIIDAEEEDSEANASKKEKESKKVTEYEYFTMENGVKYLNGEIYASQDAIELGFNVKVSYNKSKKDVDILTLDGLSKIAETALANKSVSPVVGEECSYQNKKLLKYGLVLIKNAENSYGITNYYNYNDGDNVVSCKYSYIRFCESTGNVIVTTLAEQKQGVFQIDYNTNSAKAIIEPNYQSIRRMDEEVDLFLVKINGKYGIAKIEGDKLTTVLRPEYQKIGLDKVYDDMQNEYLINNKYIPVQMDNKWGIVTKNGEQLIIPQFADIGCDLGETGTGTGVIVLPELVNGVDGIVFLVDAEKKIYNIINAQTRAKIGLDAVEVYSSYENNERKYYMKIANENGATMRVNVYDQFGKKTKEATSTDIVNATNNENAQSQLNQEQGTPVSMVDEYIIINKVA